MKKVLSYKRIYLLGLAPISLLLILAAKNSSYFAEEIYAKHIYRWLSQMISTVTGLLPFSLGELFVVAAPFAILAVLIRFLIKMIIDKKNRRDLLAKGILNVLCTGSVIWFAFTMLAGINYYRYNFSTYSNLEIQESSVDELYALTESLTLDADNLRSQISSTDEDGVYQLSMSNYELAKLADEAYSSLAEDYPVLGGSYAAPKPVLLSKLMSNTEITGVFFPFTMEANVNVDIPDFSIASTMLHELAHLRGFMREDEANYLSYLAGMKSDNVELQYSSTMLALITAGNALYDQSPDLYSKIRDMYSEGVLKDLRANSSYWVKYEDTVVSTFSNQINDTYLKANAQTDGVKSYGRMLDLLLAKYRMDQETEN
jgi:hypothetical protein